MLGEKIMKLNCLNFDKNQSYTFIDTHKNYGYYLNSNYEHMTFGVTIYNKSNNTAIELFLFDDYCIPKKDLKTSRLYVIGKKKNVLFVYELINDIYLPCCSLELERGKSLIDFYVIDGYIFIFLEQTQNLTILGYVYHKDIGFKLIKDDVLLNSITTPTYIKNTEDKEYLLIEEFKIKESENVPVGASSTNNIYIVDFKSFLKNILNKEIIPYKILRSNKGLKYTIILGNYQSKVIIFSFDYENMSIEELDVNDLSLVEKKDVKDVFLNLLNKGNDLYYIAYNNYDNEIIYDKDLNVIFPWDKGYLNNFFDFNYVYNNRYVFFVKNNIVASENVYNIYDMKMKRSKTFHCDSLLIDEDIFL